MVNYVKSKSFVKESVTQEEDENYHIKKKNILIPQEFFISLVTLVIYPITSLQQINEKKKKMNR